MKQSVCILAIMATIAPFSSAFGRSEPAGKDQGGRPFYIACVYREINGIYDELCDEAQNNLRYVAEKDENGCLPVQIVVRAYAPIPDCPKGTIVEN